MIFFGCLASGFLVLMAADFVCPAEWIMKDQLSVVVSIFWILVAYIIGQILAGPSAWLLERIVVGKLLKPPNVNLFNRTEGWLPKFFPGYFSILPKTTCDKILKKAEEAGVTETGEDLFLLAFGKVKADKDAMARLNNFLNLYGFCRNISFAALVCFAIILIGSWKYKLEGNAPWMLAALGCTLGMFYRYLKFFRQYSYELFITFAASEKPKAENGSANNK